MENPYATDDSYTGDFKTSTPAPYHTPMNPFNNQQYYNQNPGNFGTPTFPSKNKSPKGKGGARNKPQQKKVDDTPKNASMLANEVLKQIGCTWEPAESGFKCILTTGGHTFEGYAPNKKLAKEEASKMAIHELRPEQAYRISATPPAAPKAPNAPKAAGAPAAATRRPAPTDTCPTPSKKKKNTVDDANTLPDLLQRLCSEKKIKFTSLSTDVSEAGSAPEQRKYKADITFEDDGKQFSFTGDSKTSQQMVYRLALQQKFNVSEDRILSVIRKHYAHKIGKLPIIAALQYMTNATLYTQREIEYVEDPQSKQFSARIVILNTDGKEMEVLGPKSKTKNLARDRAAALALSTVYQVHPGGLEEQQAQVTRTPAAVLNEVCSRQKPAVKPTYEDLGMEEVNKEKKYKCAATVNDQKYIGIGSSKKNAKHHAAHLALKSVFFMDVPMPAEDNGKGEFRSLEESSIARDQYDLCASTCDYVHTQYHQMCKFYAIQPSSNFAAFVLMNERNERKLITIGSALQATTNPEKAMSAKGDAVFHHHSVVYARRAFVRFLTKEMSRLSASDCCLEPLPDGMLQLKKNLRVVLVTSDPVDIRYSAQESPDQSLAINGEGNLLRKWNEGKEDKDYLTVHCVADKIFKWCNLGVQGCLLTTKLSPVIPSAIFTCAPSSFSDAAYLHSFTARTAPSPFSIMVKSANITIEPSVSAPHLWSRAESKLDHMIVGSGLTVEGAPSTCSKKALYSLFLDVNPDFPRGIPYSAAKAMAGGYVASRNVLYSQLEKAGYGRWYRRPPAADDFSLQAVQT